MLKGVLEINMSITQTILSLKGSKLPRENPLPFYKDINRNRNVKLHESLLTDDNSLLGYETAPRYLPYKIQDRYDREGHMNTYKAIVLENDYLKATFLPEYGGRLYSLYDKKQEKDLIYTNPIIQPGNLAILNAWISGGIEWNVGQYGHSFTTSSPVFCGVLQDNNGEEFLRIYEYERCHNIFWHLDFHLPKNSATLNMYARIINDQDVETSMYYWTNIAVKETDKTRIFSGANEVIYLNMKNKEIAKGAMPHLPILPEKDASMPFNFSNSNEYFFQTKDERAPWEAAVYPDHWVFFERSSSLLKYRKMFCWGSHKGGQRWKDYLSEDGKGDYIEIQGGFSPTQLHGMVMEPNSTFEFVQCFGGMHLDTTQFYNEDWNEAKEELYRCINKRISEQDIDCLLEELSQYKEKKPVNVVSFGNGFGALEVYRRQKQREKNIPTGFDFPVASLTKDQSPWIHLLEYGYLPEIDPKELPKAYMTGELWAKMLLESLIKEKGNTWLTNLHLSIIHMENGCLKESEMAANRSIALAPNPLAFYNLALIYKNQNKWKAFEETFKKALYLLKEEAFIAAYTEYFKYLYSIQNYHEIWKEYNGFTENVKEDERLYLMAVKAAVKLNHLDFVKGCFDREYAYVREEETLLSDLWIEYHLRLEQSKSDCLDITLDEIEERHPVPKRLDFRMG